MAQTEVAIRQAKPAAKHYKLADGAGLYLLVTPAGRGHEQLCHHRCRVLRQAKKGRAGRLGTCHSQAERIPAVPLEFHPGQPADILAAVRKTEGKGTPATQTLSDRGGSPMVPFRKP
jgi:hypothetical protein